MKPMHVFRKPIKYINVEFIIENYSTKKIPNVLIRPFETIAITCQIYEGNGGNYHLPVVAVAMSLRSFPHAQQLHDICYFLSLWQCDTPKFSDLRASSVVWPLMLTSSPPQPSSADDVAHQDTRDPSVASPLRHTKPIAHALTQNTYGANQNEVCHKSAQEDIVDGSVFNMLGLYHDDHSTLPILHSLLTRTNSALS
jgi:hypothetical protein